MKDYTKEQIAILLSNPNVVTVKYKRQIEYKEGFKLWAVKTSLSHPEVSALQIFKKAGFDESVITSEKARMRINHWKKSYLKKCEEESKEEPSTLDVKNNEILSNLYAQFSRLVDVLEKNNSFGKF